MGALIRSFAHSDFPLARLLEHKRSTVTVVLPAKEVAKTIAPVIERIRALGELVDQILVIDAASTDGTAALASRAGAEVRQERELRPDFGPVLGKGDAMWRGLEAVRGELVVYVDSDTRDFAPHFVTGLLGPLICDEGTRFVKGSYERPFSSGGVELPEGGGRVSRLLARPLLSAFYPDLAALEQPLAGEVAATRELLERIPFATGYGVEMAMLLDVRALAGAAAIAQVDLGARRNVHQPLSRLEPMAQTVLATVCERLRREGRLQAEAGPATPQERPPWASLRATA